MPSPANKAQRVTERFLALGEIPIAWLSADPLRTLVFTGCLTLWTRLYGRWAAQAMVGLGEWASTGSVGHPEAYSLIPAWAWSLAPKLSVLGSAAPALRECLATCAETLFGLTLLYASVIAARSFVDWAREQRDLWVRARQGD